MSASLADEGGVVLKGTDAYGCAKVLEGRVTRVHRTFSSSIGCNSGLTPVREAPEKSLPTSQVQSRSPSDS